MTKDELIRFRLKIQEKCFEYLISIGYPDISDERILQELPNIWKYLDNNKLITNDMSYMSFVNACYNKYNHFRNSASFKRTNG